MKQTLVFIFLLSIVWGQAENNPKFNLGFETQGDEDELSDGWFKWGSYDLSIAESSYSGKKSGKITSDETGSSFGSIAYRIPANYEGATIKLEGFMKIKNVEDGFAGLLLRIDGSGGSLAFDNMEKQNITGTKDWQKYSITLDYSKEAKNIFVAGILVGKGEAWFDDFVLTIDGEDIQTLKEAEKELAKAELDKAFDKGSSIDISELSSEDIDNLALLGRVWGFLKYHHPEIAKGNYNWDYELFRFLPEYLEVNTVKERNKLIINWIHSLGKLEPCLMCKPVVEDAFLKPDLKWIESQAEDLKEALLEVYKGRQKGEHYYIGLSPVGGPDFLHENAYSDMPYPDDGFRLLSLYRYWNMIHYFFPYKHLMDKDWSMTLKEYISTFINAKNELDYEFAALQLIGDIQDTHANLWDGGDKINEWKGENFPPVHLRFIEDQLVVTDFYNPELKSKAGLKIGDIITSVNGKPVGEILKEKSKFYPASNVPTRLRDFSADVLRSNSTTIDINYIRNTATAVAHKLLLYPKDSLDIYRWYRKNNDKCYKLLDGNIGYVTLQSIKNKDIPEIKEKFKETKGIIIDIRNYPSTFVPFELGSYFVSSSIPFVKFTKGSTENPGAFTFTEKLEIPSDEESYKGKLVVLVNELSQSQAEYTAMAFRAGENTTIIGSTTAGADGNVSKIFLPGGLRTMISGIGVYYPNGAETQRVGIVPDVEVKPTIAGVKAGRDELLEKAVELILR